MWPSNFRPAGNLTKLQSSLSAHVGYDQETWICANFKLWKAVEIAGHGTHFDRMWGKKRAKGRKERYTIARWHQNASSSSSTTYTDLLWALKLQTATSRHQHKEKHRKIDSAIRKKESKDLLRKGLYKTPVYLLIPIEVNQTVVECWGSYCSSARQWLQKLRPIKAAQTSASIVCFECLQCFWRSCQHRTDRSEMIQMKTMSKRSRLNVQLGQFTPQVLHCTELPPKYGLSRIL